MIGGIGGFFAGIGFAQIIGHSVFASAISIRPMVIPVVAVLVVAGDPDRLYPGDPYAAEPAADGSAAREIRSEVK